jgi:hypothetical protein
MAAITSREAVESRPDVGSSASAHTGAKLTIQTLPIRLQDSKLAKEAVISTNSSAFVCVSGQQPCRYIHVLHAQTHCMCKEKRMQPPLLILCSLLHHQGMRTQEQQGGGGDQLQAQVDALALAARDAARPAVAHHLPPHLPQLQHLFVHHATKASRAAMFCSL